MNRLEALVSSFPAWVGVLSLSAVVGAVSAVLAVLVYRDMVIEVEKPIPVESE